MNLQPMYYQRNEAHQVKPNRQLKLAILLLFSICIFVFSAGQAWEARNNQQKHYHHHHKK